ARRGVAEAALVDDGHHRAAVHAELGGFRDVLPHGEVFARFLDESQRAEVDRGGERPEIALKGVQHGLLRKRTAASWAARAHFTAKAARIPLASCAPGSIPS